MRFGKSWLVGEKKQDIEHIFDGIEGHEDAKNMLLWAMQSEKPVHILLKGPFGIAKTQLIKRVRKYVGEKNSHYAIGSRTSKAGLSDLFITRPNLEYLFLDEMESLKRNDQYVLLSATEDGEISETLFGKTKGRHAQTDVRVFATTNNTRKLDRALLTRFTIVNMDGYTVEEFVSIAEKLAVSEGIDKKMIAYIAVRVYYRFYEPTPRDVIKVARMTKGDVEKIETCLKIMGKKEVDKE